jgi:hypothetical protein
MDFSNRIKNAFVLNVEKRIFAPALTGGIDVLLPKVPLTPLRAAHQHRG